MKRKSVLSLDSYSSMCDTSIKIFFSCKVRLASETSFCSSISDNSLRSNSVSFDETKMVSLHKAIITSITKTMPMPRNEMNVSQTILMTNSVTECRLKYGSFKLNNVSYVPLNTKLYSGPGTAPKADRIIITIVIT